MSKEMEERLREREREVVSIRQELIDLRGERGTEILRWKDAVRMLDERNVSLRRARINLKERERKRDEQWKSWLPSLTARANLVTSMKDLASFALSDVGGTVIAPLSIPDPITERSRAFAYALSVVQARDAYELSRRKQILTLYRVFARYGDLLREETERMPDSDAPSSVERGLDEVYKTDGGEEAKRLIEGTLVRLLDMPGRHPRPDPSTMPKIDYEREIERLETGKNYGMLAMRLSAYQIESALLSEKGVELQSWPSYSANGSVPAVYDTDREDEIGFSAEDVNLYGGISKTYRFTGAETRRVKTAKQNTEFVMQNLRQQMDLDAREWERMKERYVRLCERKTLALQRLEMLRDPGEGGSAFARLEKLRGARVDFKRIEQAKERLDLEIWLWDDRKWK
ncbi:MAG: hypothetical protein ACQCXQ_00835 [Verrucomicrobiales bacterium]|nr:hypothetical protein [Verrucomicrobiota bacterium JB025]